MTDTPMDTAAAELAELLGKATQTASQLRHRYKVPAGYYDDTDHGCNVDDPESLIMSFLDSASRGELLIRTLAIHSYTVCKNGVLDESADLIEALLTERAEMKARIAALEGHLNNIFSHFDADIWGCSTDNASGHGHQSPGIWDDDSSNGDNAGKPCGWCAQWNAARQAVASGLTKWQEQEDGFRMRMGVKNG